MVDIHSHVLWGMDDGAPTPEISLEMLRMAAESGTTDIVATPHSNAEYEYRPALIAERMAYLAGQTGGKPRIHRGCDLHLSFDNIMEALENPSKYSINGHRYMLVECSDLHIVGTMDKVLDQLLAVDLVPIVTHPERNPILQKEPKKLEKWVELGCLVQVTAGSVLGAFGKRAHAAAQELLGKGMVHVIASDAHDPVHRHPRLDDAFALISREYGADIAELLFRGNPGRIIEGKFVSGDRFAAATKRKWWQFWAGDGAGE
jgi:protein-tyrosine phosphatase